MGFAKLDLVFFSFILCHLFLLLNPAYSSCQKPFRCGNFTMEFPFSDFKNPGCGLIMVDNCDSKHEHPRIVPDSGLRYNYTILNMIPPNKLVVNDPVLQYELERKTCLILKNVALSKSPFISSTISNRNLTLFTCYNQTRFEQIEESFANYTSRKCEGVTVYYRTQPTDHFAEEISGLAREFCPMIQLPMKSNQDKDDNLFKLLEPEFTLEWNVTEECSECYHGGGQCLSSSTNEFQCKEDRKVSKVKLILIITGSVAVLLVLLCSLISYLVWLRKKRSNGSYLLSRNISSNLSSKSDIEGGSFYFGIPIFSYSELEKATNFFDPSKELGDGGFGTVYYGKLEDGREVAIKRLYEHNYKRVEQFLNEIKILTGLRHPNLVSLYGCTSRRSRELLLVYEYISNGTVADHLHGERAKEAPLTWPVRMSIAIETASALAYLHNSDIIHRDVKTNNILLDSNFCVKVADFGLSRLFPTDVTHISTAPQGTPGYVDPEYHQCYQLTDKSDVYSFGVVLAELISSMPAVDISRHRHEINLANLALNRIQRCAFDELIDPSLGYDSDPEVTRMTTSVAELAFRCLQLEKDMRPCMDEVVCFLKGIQGGDDCNFEQVNGANGNRTAPRKIPPSPETDEAVLLKNKDFKSSPTAVTDSWVSSGSTTTSSIG